MYCTEHCVLLRERTCRGQVIKSFEPGQYGLNVSCGHCGEENLIAAEASLQSSKKNKIEGRLKTEVDGQAERQLAA